MLPVFDEQLAAHLGLEELRVGSPRIDEEGDSAVLALWTVSVEPCFSQTWVIGAVYEEKWTGGPDPDRVSARGFVADREVAAICPIETDEVLESLRTLNPFRPSPTPRQKSMGFGPGQAEEMWLEMHTLDGIEYTVRWDTRATMGHFRFSNPRVDWLKEFELLLFGFASRVVSASGECRLEQHFNLWAESQEELGRPPTDGLSPSLQS